MTKEMCQEAVVQMVRQCEGMMDAYKSGAGEYRSVSARSVLRELGYDGNDLQQVLEFVAAGGFDYCLDPAIKMTGAHEANGERPHRDVCWWGADQLLSRLQCLRNVRVSRA